MKRHSIGTWVWYAIIIAFVLFTIRGVFVLMRMNDHVSLVSETHETQIVDLGTFSGIIVCFEPKERPINFQELEKALQPFSKEKEDKQ